MSSEITPLEVHVRHSHGKGAARSLRREGLIPAVLYGAGGDNVMLSLDPHDFRKVTNHDKEWNTVYHLTLKCEGQPDATEVCMLADVQRDSVRRDVVHLDFMRIDLEKEVVRKIPVEYTGRAVGVVKGGKLRTFRRFAKVAARPDDLPIKVTVDISPVDGGQGLRFSDIALEKARFVEDLNQRLCFIAIPKARKAEVEDDKKKKKKK